MQSQSAAIVNLIKSAPYKFQPASTVPKYLLSRRSVNIASFQAWSHAFENFEAEQEQPVPVRNSNRPEIASDVDCSKDSAPCLRTARDGEIVLPFDAAGDRLLDWAEQALEESPASNKARCAFSPDLGIGPPIYLLVMKTADAEIRRRGLDLLARMQKLEGWHKPQAMLQTVRDLSAAKEEASHFSGRIGWQMDPQRMPLEWVAEEVGVRL